MFVLLMTMICVVIIFEGFDLFSVLEFLVRVIRFCRFLLVCGNGGEWGDLGGRALFGFNLLGGRLL